MTDNKNAYRNAQKLRQMKDSNYSAQRKWDKENMTSITIRLNKNADSDIISFWSSLPNKADWFRSVCRKYIDILRKQ